MTLRSALISKEEGSTSLQRRTKRKRSGVESLQEHIKSKEQGNKVFQELLENKRAKDHMASRTAFTAKARALEDHEKASED